MTRATKIRFNREWNH